MEPDEQHEAQETLPKAYWIDFECWKISANSPDEAEEKARDYIKQGKVPNICGSADIAEEESIEDELYDYMQLEVRGK
jgi:hypothetical protein